MGYAWVRAGLTAAAALWLGAAAPLPPVVQVSIDNFSFMMPTVTVPVGTTVVWTNHDDVPHTVTSADTPRGFTSPPLDTDEHYAHRFDHVGRFAYFCSLHPQMQAMVIVR